MNRSPVEVIVGIFVLVGIVCVGWLTIKLGKMELLGDHHYVIKARFQSVTGLKVGASIEMAGVEIGKVDQIRLDTQKQVAEVSLKIDKTVELTEDTIASIKTAGLIGDKYIKLSPGGSDEILASGDVITETESSLDIEELVSKFVFGGV